MKSVYITTTGDNTIEFPVPLEVEGYGCGVVEMNGRIKNGFREPLFLCCDFCEESYVNNIKMPVLRFINRNANGLLNKGIDHIIWLRVMRPSISSIRLYIADAYGKIVSVENNELSCTLLFIPHSS